MFTAVSLKNAPHESRYRVSHDVRKLVDVHAWLSFDQAELLVLHMIDKNWPQRRYNTFEALCKIGYGILQRETESQIQERIQDAEAWFKVSEVE